MSKYRSSIVLICLFICNTSWGQTQINLDSLLQVISAYEKNSNTNKPAPDSLYNIMRLAAYNSGQLETESQKTQSSTSSTNSYSFKIPNYGPQSPELEAYKLCGNIPVGEYTGTPDISIPIYTMKQGSIEFPITLSYHASGIKVAQEATWVGLGWNLMAGGAISLEPVGAVDLSLSEFDGETWRDFQTMVQNWNIVNRVDTTEIRFGHEVGFHHWSCYPTVPAITPTSVINQALWWSGERDVYNVTLPNGTSFKFILHPKNEKSVIVGKANNYKISYNRERIYIVDEDGTTYQYVGLDCNTNWKQEPTGFRLERIINKEGKTIQFTYRTSSQRLIPNISEHFIMDTYSRARPTSLISPSRTISFSSESNIESYLYKIESDLEEITFETLYRRDRYIRNSGLLSAIIIKNKLTQKEIFRYVFYYDYFTGAKKGGDYLSVEDNRVESTVIPEDLRKLRLKLLSLKKTNLESNLKETYSFSYNEEVSLPYKTSFAQDYWGYYNGAENLSSLTNYKRTLLPNLDRTFTESSMFGSVGGYPYPGAIRNSSVDNVSAGMLKSVTYPTGGTVEFEFEPHTFGNYKIVSKEDVDAHLDVARRIYTIVNNNGEFSTFSQFFTLIFPQTVDFEITVLFADYTMQQVLGSGSSIIMTGSPGNPAKIMANLSVTEGDLFVTDDRGVLIPNPAKSIVKTIQVTLPAGNYILSTGLSSSIPDQGIYSGRNSSSGCVAYKTRQIDTNALLSVGGGVRIKRIIKKDQDNSVIENIKYTYEDENGRTSGLLLTPLKMITSKDVKWVPSPGCEGDRDPTSYGYHLISSIPDGSHPAFSANAVIGYSRVVKEVITADEGGGKTAYHFTNESLDQLLTKNFAETGFVDLSRLYPRLMFPPNNNGALVEKQIYNAENELLQMETFQYKVADIKKEMLNISAVDNYLGPIDICCAGLGVPYNRYMYTGRFDLTLYPNVSYWFDLINRTTTSWYGSASVVNKEEYSYNSIHQVASVRKNPDDPVAYVNETFIYPVDIKAMYGEMYASNILNPIIRHNIIKGNSFVSITNAYAGYQNRYALTSTTETIESLTTRRIEYKYDIKYNPVEVTYQDEISEVYLWGYNYNYVIAHIKNATYETVQSRMGNDLNTLCSLSAPDPVILNRIRTLFPESEVTTWLYDPSVGVTRQTGPGNLNTYYEYDNLNRLSRIKDNEQKIIQEFFYHYKE